MAYVNGIKVEINDVVIIPSLDSFAGEVRGIFPPEGEIEIVSSRNPWDVVIAKIEDVIFPLAF